MQGKGVLRGFFGGGEDKLTLNMITEVGKWSPCGDRSKISVM